MRRAVQGLDRLGDLEEVLRQERTQGTRHREKAAWR
jgi:hypothetical protein